MPRSDTIVAVLGFIKTSFKGTERAFHYNKLVRYHMNLKWHFDDLIRHQTSDIIIIIWEPELVFKRLDML